MSDLAPSVIAVVGTLAGAAVAYGFNERSRDRDRRSAQYVASRQERLAVYSDFIAVVTDLRRVKYDRWHRYSEDPKSDEALTARREVHRVRVVARSALARIELTAREGLDDGVVEAARKALDLVEQITTGSTSTEFEEAGDAARSAVSLFVTVAAEATRRS